MCIKNIVTSQFTTDRIAGPVLIHISMKCLLAALLITIYFISKCDGYAVWMIDSEFSCSKEMAPGDVIMNHLVVPHSDSKYKLNLEAYRKSAGVWSQINIGMKKNDGIAIAKYLPGEEIHVRMGIPDQYLKVKAPDDVQFVFELDTTSNQALFIEGNVGCNGKRVVGYGTGENREIILKFAGDTDIVTLSGGWATGKEAVVLVPPIHFVRLGVETRDAITILRSRVEMREGGNSHDDEL